MASLASNVYLTIIEVLILGAHNHWSDQVPEQLRSPNDSHRKHLHRPLYPENTMVLWVTSPPHRFYVKLGSCPHLTLRIYSPQASAKYTLVHVEFVGAISCSMERRPVFYTFLASPNIGRFFETRWVLASPPLKAILARSKEMTHSF